MLHVVVTGQRLFAGIMNKREQLQLLYQTDLPQLSAALADYLSSPNPTPSPGTACKFPSLLDDNNRHPSARLDIISSCHNVCMQPLMESCLASNPHDRPSAQGLCSKLLLCPGAMPQSDYYISSPVQHAVYSPTANVVIGIHRDGQDHVTVFPPNNAWQMRQCPTPYSGERFSCIEIIRNEIVLASCDSLLLYSLQLPDLQSGHISSTLLIGKPLCLFSDHEKRMVVGMTEARIAIFSSSADGRLLLESKPHVTQVGRYNKRVLSPCNSRDYIIINCYYTVSTPSPTPSPSPHPYP